jgi:hypothetical protein
MALDCSDELYQLVLGSRKRAAVSVDATLLLGALRFVRQGPRREAVTSRQQPGA